MHNETKNVKFVKKLTVSQNMIEINTLTDDNDNPDLEEQMHAEDEYFQALIERDNQISFLREQNQKKGKALNEKEKALQEKNMALENKKSKSKQL